MSDELSADIEALLASEREAAGAPPAARADLLARLEAIPNTQVAPGGLAGAAGKTAALLALAVGVGWLAWPAAPPPRPAVADAPPIARPAAEPAPGPNQALSAPALPAPQPEPIPAAAPEPALAAPATPEPAPAAAPAAPAPAPAAALVPPPPPPRAPAPASPPADLDAERRLVDAARAALSAGSPAAALTTLSEHRQRFRRGALVEERESLRVRATAALGRHAEAARLRSAFLSRWPHSVYRAALEAPPAPPGP